MKTHGTRSFSSPCLNRIRRHIKFFSPRYENFHSLFFFIQITNISIVIDNKIMEDLEFMFFPELSGPAQEYVSQGIFIHIYVYYIRRVPRTAPLFIYTLYTRTIGYRETRAKSPLSLSLRILSQYAAAAFGPVIGYLFSHRRESHV